MQTNIHSIINQTVRFLTFLFLLSLMTGCFLFEEDKESKQRSKNKQLFMIFGSLLLNANECLGRNNIDITEGQTLGPYTNRQCFKISISGDTSVNIITPGTSTASVIVWSSDAIPSRRQILYQNDPTLTISGPGIWYADTGCHSCNSYSISIP